MSAPDDTPPTSGDTSKSLDGAFSVMYEAITGGTDRWQALADYLEVDRPRAKTVGYALIWSTKGVDPLSDKLMQEASE